MLIKEQNIATIREIAAHVSQGMALAVKLSNLEDEDWDLIDASVSLVHDEGGAFYDAAFSVYSGLVGAREVAISVSEDEDADEE